MVSRRYLASAGTRLRFSSAAKGSAAVRLSQAERNGCPVRVFLAGHPRFYTLEGSLAFEEVLPRKGFAGAFASLGRNDESLRRSVFGRRSWGFIG